MFPQCYLLYPFMIIIFEHVSQYNPVFCGKSEGKESEDHCIWTVRCKKMEFRFCASLDLEARAGAWCPLGPPWNWRPEKAPFSTNRSRLTTTRRWSPLGKPFWRTDRESFKCLGEATKRSAFLSVFYQRL